MIRPATLADLDMLIRVSTKACELYPKLVPDIKKIRAVLIEAISSPANFAYVSDDEGEITGVLIGLTGKNLWAQRQNCFIPMWLSSKPGEGVMLLRRFKQWLITRRGIRVAGFSPDISEIDPRTWELVELLGFKRYGGAYLLYN